MSSSSMRSPPNDRGVVCAARDPRTTASRTRPQSASTPRLPRPDADADADTGDGETIEYKVDDALPPRGGEDEDVLEETPEFLQDTPDHDRLWFEQRPPRDFDFDG